MNILVISQYFFPEQFLINDITKELVNRGHNVTVLTGLPNYPNGEVPKDYKWFKNRREVINGVEVYRSFEIGRRTGTLSLFLNYVSYALSASIRVLFSNKHFNIIFCYQVSPITMGIPSIIARRKFKAPILLYCLDLFPESVKSHTKNNENIVYKAVHRLSKYIYTKCDKIAVSSKSFITYLTKVNDVEASRLSYLPQYASDILLSKNLTSSNNGSIDFMFAGNIGYGQNIECIIDAVEIIKDVPNFTVHIVGDGSRLPYIKELVNKKGLIDKFTFHGKHPSEEMHRFYKLADVLLITLRSDNYVSNTIPGKLQTYLTTGKTIIGAINGDGQEIIKESQCGLCVNAGDAEGLAWAMREFILNIDNFGDCGLNAQKYYLENFTAESFYASLTKMMNDLVEL